MQGVRQSVEMGLLMGNEDKDTVDRTSFAESKEKLVGTTAEIFYSSAVNWKSTNLGLSWGCGG